MPAGARKSLEHNAELTAACWAFDTVHNDKSRGIEANPAVDDYSHSLATTFILLKSGNVLKSSNG